MVCCLNPDCSNPHNPDQLKFCQSCGEAIIPLLLNRFKVTKVLGRGGFGKTYLAEDSHKFDEDCVVKQLVTNTQGTWAKKKAIELFKQEAQQLQQLGDNYHIPSLYAYFEQGSYLYLVQQFIKGQDLLKELTQKGAWQETEIKQLLLQLLPVLQFIHAKGVIHRDIKPENIMRHQLANKVDASGDLVLIDFGVSKQLFNTVLKTTVGTMIGSPGYAPLEQMQGGEAYPAGDLFSLGATCFHLLTNIHPFQLFLDHGYSWINNWQSHLPNQISKDLIRVMDRLLAQEVQARYQFSQEVIEDLQTALISSAQPPTIPVAHFAPTVLSIPPKTQSINKVHRHYRQSKQDLPSQEKRSFDKKLIAGATIALIGLVGYVYFDSILNQTTVDLLTPRLSWKYATLFATLTGHSSSVFSVAFSPDSKTLASGSNDKTIKLWDVATTQTIATLTGHSSSVFSIAFSPDGKTLASGSFDKTIRLWDLENKTAIVVLTGHSNSIESVAFSPDGKTLASASSDNTIKLWDLETNQEIITLTRHSSNVEFVAFSPDGNTLASGSSDNTIKLWDLETNQEITTLTRYSSDVESVAFSPDGKTLASGTYHNTIKLWRLP